MEKLFNPYQGGRGDENFAVYQANKTVWYAREREEKIIEPIYAQLKRDIEAKEKAIIALEAARERKVLTQKANHIDEYYSNEMLDSSPFIALGFEHEFPEDSQEALSRLLPKEYKETDSPVSHWRHDAKLLLECDLERRIPELKERSEKIFRTEKGSAPPNSTLRAVNNLIYFAKEEFYTSSRFPRAYQTSFNRYLNKQRKIIREIVGDENSKNILILLEYLECVFHSSGRKISGKKYRETRQLLRKQYSTHIKKQIRRATAEDKYKIRNNAEMRRAVMGFALDDLFGELPPEPEANFEL